MRLKESKVYFAYNSTSSSSIPLERGYNSLWHLQNKKMWFEVAIEPERLTIDAHFDGPPDFRAWRAREQTQTIEATCLHDFNKV